MTAAGGVRLRRMQPGAVLGEAWQLYKRHWQHLLPLALVVYLVLSLVTLLLTTLFGVVGAIVGVPVPIIGSVIGAFLGAFVGAWLLERSRGTELGATTRVAQGALIGRVVAAAMKTGLGVAIMAWLVFAAVV